jgi:hypothetical protein
MTWLPQGWLLSRHLRRDGSTRWSLWSRSHLENHSLTDWLPHLWMCPYPPPCKCHCG